MAYVLTDVDTFSPNFMYIVTTDIISPVTSILIDNKDVQYDNNEIDFAAIPVDPTITNPEITDPFDSNKIKDSTGAYATSLDCCPSSSDFEKYFDCIDESSYLSADFNSEEETHTRSVETIITEVHEHILATTSIESFSDLLNKCSLLVTNNYS